ncbi:uncharacterized protein B0I36DRAFT_2901 [Microdochium trichocladiopsis]|uniref:Defect at low temperature protein 1 n=1 Tax=Microdochium trichocladiopsis TaxID=1682393 RepID=A0A9P9BV19_9PEZI|nr:uncharacterized protein B0I36DRAFT_2901 [Microdochium trichocladiopsis]KAH7039853.1 hypothetical protein B0I36DRAFT_2901 [Microdochium trichocladiopsis]
MSTTHLIFRIVYNSIYVVLCILTAALLLVVPGDIAVQAIFISQSWINVVILGIVLALALLIILFVYVTRLFITRMALAAIPRAWIPIEKGDVSKNVRELILDDLKRSALIAWTARPKVTSLLDQPVVESESQHEGAELQAASTAEKSSLPGLKSFQALRASKSKSKTIDKPPEITVHTASQPVWGHIEHNGWGSPNLPDLPNLQYSAVLAELPNLVEAQAIRLARASIDSTDDLPLFDEDTLKSLALQHYMSMRTYVGHLTSLGVLRDSQITVEFLEIYEKARFSAQPMSEDTFRRLMHLFAELLRNMQPMQTSIFRASSDIDDYEGEDYEDSEDGHIDDDAPQDTTPTTPARSVARSRSMRSYQSSMQSRTGSNHLAVGSYYSAHTSSRPQQSRRQQQQSFRTAPTTPRSRLDRASSNRSSSTASQIERNFAQTKKPYTASQFSSSSNASLRSGGSGSQGSVIRLATAGDDSELPYVLTPVHSYTY